MAELTIRFDVRVTPAVLRTAVAAVLLTVAAPELGSESVTLSTYYPAPSGVYANMITTGQTLVARDGGNVGIGLGGSAPSYKLHVNGTTYANGAILAAQNNYMNVGTAYLSSGGNYMHLANKTYYNGSGWTFPNGGNGALLQMADDTITFYKHNGSAFTTEMQINPGGYTMFAHPTTGNSYIYGGVMEAQQPVGQCSFVNIGTGTTPCPANTYATMHQGYMSRYVAMGYIPSTTGIGTMLCCACPGGACPSLP